MNVKENITYGGVNPFEKITLNKEWHTVERALHSHAFVELVYIYGGDGTHIINECAVHVSTGDLLIMAYGDVHAFAPTQGHGIGIFNCLFLAEFLNDLLPADASFPQLLQFPPFAALGVDNVPMPIRLYGEAQLSIDALLHQMLNEFDQKQPGYIDVLRAQLNVLLLQITRFLMPKPTPKKPAPHKKDKLPDGLLAYLQQNCHQKLALTDIADKCHYSPAYFSDLFHQSTGMTFSAYVRQLRLEASMRYITQTDLPIDKIRQLAGFGNSTVFFRAFRDATGITPQEYRDKAAK